MLKKLFSNNVVVKQQYLGFSNLITKSKFSVDQIKDLKLGKLNHIAIAVPNLEESTALYRDVFGADVSEPQVHSLLLII
eukprot:TRINITY_DN18616_c0_g1_i1.p1 TRINITY_DN18616_c0_g1~~TRINITY_DN18616_c0_g1_i1.p1  ORF type:complete len:79 (+),score=0.83 TRINITY_DN18616_c0_g1_i1:61-297(+)